MLIDPERAKEHLDADLTKVRATVRMRLGVVAGIVIVGLIQTHFDITDKSDAVGIARAVYAAALPIFGIAVAGILLVVLLAVRDSKRARHRYESTRFRIPTRKTRR